MANYEKSNLYYFGNYSDYFNRIIKRENNLADYLNIIPLQYSLIGFNFNPGDDVNVTRIDNWEADWTPDYLVVVNQLAPNEIVSRWFVVETQRIRGKQYNFTLRRDVIADNYISVIKAPVYIEKATLENTDPFILNKEEIAFNQIKKEEVLLKDKTACPWIIGYVSRGQNINKIETAIKANYDYTLADFNQKYGLNLAINNPYQQIKIDLDYKIELYMPDYSSNPRCLIYVGDSAGNFTLKADFATSDKANVDKAIYNYINMRNYLTSNFTYPNVINALKTAIKTARNNFERDLLNELLNEKDKIIFVNGQYFKINIAQLEATGYENVLYSRDSAVGVPIDYALEDSLTMYNNKYGTDVGITNNSYLIKFENEVYGIAIEPTTVGSVEFTLDNERNVLEDAPYDMFAIPYGAITFQKTQNEYQTTKELAINVAQAIGNSGGSTWLFDIQLLPYCPVLDKFKENKFNLDEMQEKQDYSLITTSGEVNTPVGVIFWATKSTGTFDIEYVKEVQDYKVENETDMYRLVSPNYNGIFEFNIAKMRGLRGFNVDFTYKPFNPYIHVNPSFAWLYGKDFDDARGLICGGDFSVAVATDRWAQYEVTNKNYQNIFDRGIQHLEFTQKQETISSIVGAVSGTVAGAGAGATMGAKAGPAGMVAGAIAGGVAAGAGGVADLIMLGSRQEEARSFAVDNYNMQLDNIRALPDSLTKSSALSANNKLFPFLEYYTCTDEEKEAFRQKLYFDGMTVGRIDKIENYLKIDYSFIRGQLIRLEGPFETHVINAIYEELRKGVFIK